MFINIYKTFEQDKTFHRPNYHNSPLKIGIMIHPLWWTVQQELVMVTITLCSKTVAQALAAE